MSKWAYNARTAVLVGAVPSEQVQPCIALGGCKLLLCRADAVLLHDIEAMHLHSSGLGVFCDIAKECLLHDFQCLFQLRCKLGIFESIPHSLQILCIPQEIVVVCLSLSQSCTGVALSTKQQLCETENACPLIEL